MQYTNEDIVEDEIYYNKTPYGKEFLDKAGHNNINTKCFVDISGSRFCFGSITTTINLTHCRLATLEERNWVIACEQAGKFIPLNEVKSETYEIY